MPGAEWAPGPGGEGLVVARRISVMETVSEWAPVLGSRNPRVNMREQLFPESDGCWVSGGKDPQG